MRFSIEAQIAEVEREIQMRIDVYARQIANGKMRRSVADYHTDCMRAVLQTLHGVQNEPRRQQLRSQGT